MFWGIIGIILGLLLVYKFIIKPQLYWKDLGVPQGPPIPLLGDNWKFFLYLETMEEFLIRVYNYSPNARYTGIYQTMMPGLLIRTPDLIKQLAIKDFEHFMDHRNFLPERFDPVWTRNLFTLRGEEWRSMRATLTPAFTSSKMKAMFKIMNESGKQYVNYYLKKDQSVVKIEGKDSFSKFANDVIANCAFGITCDSLENPNNDFYQHGHAVTDLTGFSDVFKFILTAVLPKVADFFRLAIIPEGAGDYFKSVVKDTVSYRMEHHITRPDVINLLMEAREGKLKLDKSKEENMGFAVAEESEMIKNENIKKSELTDVDLAAQVMIFFFAGFDTVSTMMSFMAHELATHQDIQERLRKEIDEQLEETPELTYETLMRMKYLDMVISESLRKNPPVVGQERVCTKPYVIEPVQPGEVPVKVDVGMTVGYPTIGLHYDPQYFPNPTKFDPERFSDENKHKIKPYTYMPFGVGPRSCIGSRFALMEIKLFFFHILYKFEIVVIDETPIPLKTTKATLTPRIAGGCWVGLKRR